ncbi:hypothetical protein ACHHYP_02954 [Achlya hypogyna]|uniref:Cilia- and flagella-associated protein 157 n=1 Tax=Achlya hypogyna TaxID=1202772 RepID=A0A1V9Z532_ACHHY|nr:hypothetical protein ACHHYP_02954 [Achlya hypogyna]
MDPTTMDDDVLFDAMDSVPQVKETRPSDDGPDIKDRVYMDQILQLTQQVNQLKTAATEHSATRVQSAAEMAMLRQQLERQESVAKHLKQMLKNMSDKYSGLQCEYKAFKKHTEALTAELSTTKDLVRDRDATIASFRAKHVEWMETAVSLAEITRERDEVVADRDVWKAKACHLSGVAEANESLRSEMASMEQEADLARKRSHHIIKELRKSLQEERSKPPVVVSTPLAVQCITVADDPLLPQSADLVQEFALRIEVLLQANASLTERVKFLETNAQLLATDLERKRLVLRQLTLSLTTDADAEVNALALAKVAEVELLDTAQTLLYATLMENLALKVRYWALRLS